MLKEIMSQPALLEDCMRGRVNAAMGNIRLGGLEKGDTLERLVNAKRIIICACGTSFHSGLVGEYLLESLARIPVEVEYASEFRYRNPIISSDDIIIVISQSGETADTLAALNLAKEKGCHTIGLVNVVRTVGVTPLSKLPVLRFMLAAVVEPHDPRPVCHVTLSCVTAHAPVCVRDHRSAPASRVPPTRACTCTSAPRSASHPPRPSRARCWC